MSDGNPRVWTTRGDRISPYCLYPDNRYLRRMLAGNMLYALILGCEEDKRQTVSVPSGLGKWREGLAFAIHAMQHPFPLEDFEDDEESARNASESMMQESMKFYLEQIRGVAPYRLAVQWMPAIVDTCKSIQVDSLLWFLYQADLIKPDNDLLDHLDTMVSLAARQGFIGDEVAEALSDAGMMATWFLANQLELFACLADLPQDQFRAVIDAAGLAQEVINYDQLREPGESS